MSKTLEYLIRTWGIEYYHGKTSKSNLNSIQEAFKKIEKHEKEIDACIARVRKLCKD
jgi:ferritin